ncbi:MAG: hypothetical protein IJR40_06785, partial [Treponema sp.]|nr:hypothetical protein [Treponema sp.]
ERRMDNCVRKLDELCERTAGLASATGRVMDLFAETELSIRRGMEGLAVNAAAGPGGAPHGSQPGAAATARLNGPATIVPDWLERAANRYYGGGGGAW